MSNEDKRVGLEESIKPSALRDTEKSILRRDSTTGSITGPKNNNHNDIMNILKQQDKDKKKK